MFDFSNLAPALCWRVPDLFSVIGNHQGEDLRKINFCIGILATICAAPALAKVWDLNRVHQKAAVNVSTIANSQEIAGELSARKGLFATTENGSTSAAKSGGPCGAVVNSVPVYSQTSKALEGCRLEVVEQDSIYASLGLKRGDVVQPNSGQMKMEVFQQAGHSEHGDLK